jgi:RNA polymerase sigma-70 factor (ECF subfamily)
MTDAAIVRRVLDGDSDAYAILVDRYYDRYARFAVHMLGNREDAEEALQDAFLRAYRALPRYEERERFGAWLFRMLVNRCRTTAVRRRRREKMFPSGELALLSASVQPDVEDSAWREELTRALAVLPAEQREAFLLKHVEDLSYEEMAELTGAGVSALKMRVKRACSRLRELLQEEHSVGTT